MDLIQVGQKLSINIINDNKLIEIIGSISDILEDRLIIELPPYFMRYIEYFDVGSELTIKIFSKLGTIDFNTIVITSPLEEDDFAIEYDSNAVKLTPGSELPVIQAIENLKIIHGENSYNTKTFEISTEYIKFYSDNDFEVGDKIKCELKFPKNYGTITFEATISEQDAVYDNEYTITYYNMNEQDRQTLLYYMYVYTNSTGQDVK